MGIPTSVADINAFTNRFLVPKATNVVYKESPLFVRLINRNNVAFPGGTSITEPIIYAELTGGAFAKTGTFDTAYVQTEAAWNVALKYYYTGITLYGTDSVLNRGREAAFSVVEMKMANAAMKMAKLLATDFYKDGQTSSSDVTTSGGLLSESTSFDGLLAWIDDGNSVGTTTYTAATTIAKSFETVGGLTRDDLFASTPTFTGATTPLTALGGGNSYVNRGFTSFSLPEINKAMGYATYGRKSPDMLVCTQTGWNKFWNAIQPNQRYMEESSDLAKIGFRSFQFNGASVVVDQYAPEQVLWMLNTDTIKLYVSDNPKYQLGFTGFKEAQNSDNYVGQFLFGGALVVPSPRHNAKVIGAGLS